MLPRNRLLGLSPAKVVFARSGLGYYVDVAPGRYMLAVTATDGSISRSAYLRLTVLP